VTQAETLAAMQADIKEIRESQIRHETKVPQCDKRFTDVEHTLYGNDKPGLKSDMTRLKVWVTVGSGACGLGGVVLGFLLEKLLG